MLLVERVEQIYKVRKRVREDVRVREKISIVEMLQRLKTTILRL